MKFPLQVIIAIAFALLTITHGQAKVAPENSPRLVLQITVDQLQGYMPAPNISGSKHLRVL